MKLNLGCGVYPFPLDREHIPNPEHLGELPDAVFEPGWVNVDKRAAPGVQETINLFRFPWVRSSNGSPFNDNTASVIWAAHLLEHVPHQVQAAPNLPGQLAGPYAQMVEDYDGFFVFMAECWRILEPGGLMYVRFPYATNYAALSDPTHTRYLTPGTFSYLGTPDPGTPFDYQVPCHFEMIEPFTMRFHGEWIERSKDYSPEGWMNQVRSNHSIVDEIRLTLTAVKE